MNRLQSGPRRRLGKLLRIKNPKSPEEDGIQSRRQFPFRRLRLRIHVRRLLRRHRGVQEGRHLPPDAKARKRKVRVRLLRF